MLRATRRGLGGFGSTGISGEGLGTSGYEAQVMAIDQYFMRGVLEIAKLSDCVRGCPKDEEGKYMYDEYGHLVGQKRRFGCIIARGLSVVASGFNCQYPGADKCAEVGCLRDTESIPSGQQMERCRAIHAEQSAIISAAREGGIQGTTMYVNAEPCLYCARMIAGLKSVGLESLVILAGEYPNHGLDIVRNAGIEVRTVSLPEAPLLEMSEQLRVEGVTTDEMVEALSQLR